MNDLCREMQDKIADYVLGALPKDEIENLDKHINRCSQCGKYAEALQNEKNSLLQLGDDLGEQIHAQEARIIEALNQVSPVKPRLPSIGRFVMRHQITKIAAAAMIIATVFLAITLFDRVATSAYAIEQSIQANHTVQTIHLRAYRGQDDVDSNNYMECWVEYDETGMVSNFRQDMFDDGSEQGESVKHLVWNEGVSKLWMPEKNVLIVHRVNNLQEHWDHFVGAYDPKLIMQRLYDQQEAGAVILEIDEPVRAGDPIYVRATNSDDNTRLELVIDSETKLVTQLTKYRPSEDEDELVMRIEFFAYNSPIDPSTFELGDIPDDAFVFDQVNQLVGLEKGDLTNDEIAAKVVRECLEATIAQDYEEVSRLMEGDPGDSFEVFVEATFGAKITRVISIGQSKPHERWQIILCVPCEIEVRDEEGQLSTVNIIATAKPIGYQPGRRWIVHTEIRASNPIGTQFGKEINAKVAQFKINTATLDDVIEVFGEPAKYVWGNQVFPEDDLPDRYVMAYPTGKFCIMMVKDYVEELRFERSDSGYVFAETLRMGSSLEEVLEVLGPPAETVVGEECKWKKGVLYKDITRQGHCYYAPLDHGVRMFFFNSKIVGLYVTRTEPIPNK